MWQLRAFGAFLAAVLLFCPTSVLGADFQFHVVSANEWLYPDTPMPDSPVTSVDLHAPRGGRTGFQVLLRGVAAAQPMSSEFVGPLAPSLYQLIDVRVPENTGPPCSAVPPDQPTPDYVVRKAPYRVFEALKPLTGCQAAARGEVDALYASFRIPANAEPGRKTGRLQIRVGPHSAEIPVTLTVYPAQVPADGHLRVTNWFSTGAMARLHGLEPWSEAHWEMLRQHARLMRRGRQTDFIPVRPESEKRADGTWTFDFSWTERMIRMFLDEGFTHIELPHVASHDRRKEAVARFVIRVDGTPVPATSHEAYVYLAEYLGAWSELLKKNG